MGKMFCERLRMLRGDMLQEELAQELGISRSAVSHLENGRHEPGLELLERLADFFDVSADYLIGRTNFRGTSNNMPSTQGEYELVMRELDSLRTENENAIQKIKDMINGKIPRK